jgi:hypothetical protein
MEHGNSRRVNSNLPIKWGKVCETGIEIQLWMLLIMNKLLYEVGEIQFFDFDSNVARVNFAYCKCSSVYSAIL